MITQYKRGILKMKDRTMKMSEIRFFNPESYIPQMLDEGKDHCEECKQVIFHWYILYQNVLKNAVDTAPDEEEAANLPQNVDLEMPKQKPQKHSSEIRNLMASNRHLIAK